LNRHRQPSLVAPRGALAALLGLLLAGSTVVALAAPSNTYAPPLPPRNNKSLLAGEKLWSTNRLVGPGGRSCAACHDTARGPALTARTLQRKYDDLEKLVYFELVARTRNREVAPNGPEVRALVSYLKDKYDLKPMALDDPQAEAGVELARSYFVQGELERALGLLESTLRLATTPQLQAEIHLLTGCVHHVLGDEPRAMEDFARVFDLYPEADIDKEVFSPKTVALFEAVRQMSVGNRRTAKKGN
jgi:tetratricopeptide (TPR) repeat protein